MNIDKDITKLELNSDYQAMMNILKQSIEYYEVTRDQIYKMLREKYELNVKCLSSILKFTLEEIDDFDRDQIITFLEAHSLSAKDRWSIQSTGELQDTIESIKTSSMFLYSLKTQIDDIQDEVKAVTAEYLRMISSKDTYENKMKKIVEYSGKIDSIQDETEQRRSMEMLTILKKSYDFSFLLDRINQIGQKEIDSILEGYFNNRKGEYIIKRAREKLPKYNLSPSIYRNFFNIEETFLEEEYWDYNNLFLYIYLRTIAYSDPYNTKDKMYVQSLTSALTNLVQHGFDENQLSDKTVKHVFISTIKEVLDKFSDYKEKFKNENTTSPNNKIRQERKMKLEEERKEDLLEKLKNLSENESDFDENMDIDELQTIYTNKLSELVKKQNKEYRKLVDEDVINGYGIIEDHIEKLNSSRDMYLERIKEGMKNGNTEKEDEKENTSVTEVEEVDKSASETEKSQEESKHQEEQQKKVVAVDLKDLDFVPDTNAQLNDMFNNIMSDLSIDESKKDIYDPGSEPGMHLYRQYTNAFDYIQNLYNKGQMSRPDAIANVKRAYKLYVQKMTEAGYVNRFEELRIR